MPGKVVMVSASSNCHVSLIPSKTMPVVTLSSKRRDQSQSCRNQCFCLKGRHDQLYKFLRLKKRNDSKSHRNNQQDATVQQNLLFQCFLIAQHVSDDTPPIIRSSKTLIAASGFTYVFGCPPLRWLSHHNGGQLKIYVKPEAAITVFELLMMGGVSSETC